LAAPSTEENDAAGQNKHVLPPAPYVPSGHVSQLSDDEAPDAEEYDPLKHRVHELAAVAPTKLEYDPAKHRVHAVAPEALKNDPA